MSNKPVLAVVLLATVGVAAGSAWALSGAAPDTASHVDADHAAMLRDLGKLSADASKGFQDLRLTRLAIYNGDTTHAKTYVDEADASFAKAKSDDSVFMKDEAELKTADQMKTAAKTPAKPSASSAPAAKDAPTASTSKIAWLPVDGAMSLDEDFSMSPTKAKAVDDANKSLAKGDRKGAIEKLKLAEVSTSLVIEVVPRDQAVNDVHQAAQLIDSGKYYEGSQVLRKVQMAARFDVTNIVGVPKTASSAPATAKPATKPAAPTTTH